MGFQIQVIYYRMKCINTAIMKNTTLYFYINQTNYINKNSIDIAFNT